VIHLDAHKLAILKSKAWIRWMEPSLITGADAETIAAPLSVCLASTEVWLGSAGTTRMRQGVRLMHVRATGTVRLGETLVAAIDYHRERVKGNVPTALFARLGARNELAVFFEGGGYSLLASPDIVTAPEENHTYAEASRDHNPIHTNPLFATLAALPSTITHGMWSSANARRVVESYVANEQVHAPCFYRPRHPELIQCAIA